MDNRLLTVSEASEYLRCSKRVTYHLCQEKRIPVIKIGRQYLIPLNELNQWIHSNCGKKNTV